MIKKIKPELIKKKSNYTLVYGQNKKKINTEYIDLFWKNYFSGTLEKNALSRTKKTIISELNKNLKILRLSPSVAVTVRKCPIYTGKVYLETVNYFKKHPEKLTLKHSDVFLTGIIDYKIKDGDYYIMERIIPSISILDFTEHDANRKLNNRYLTSFLNKHKNLDLDVLKIDLKRAREELQFKLHNLDSSSGNIIIYDYNPTTHKFKFGLVDFYGNNSSSF